MSVPSREGKVGMGEKEVEKGKEERMEENWREIGQGGGREEDSH